MFNTLNLII